MEIKIYGEDSPLSGGTRYVTAISAETGFFDSFTITDIQSGSSVASLFITESGSVISGETNNFTGDTYWTSGTTGTTSIKAINSTGLDSTGNRSVAWGNQTLALGDDSTAWGYLTTAGWKGFTVSSVVAGLITISDNVDYSTEFTSGTVLLDSTQYTYNTVTFSSPNFTIQLNDTTVNTGTYVSDLSNLNSPLATVTVGNGAHSAGDSTKSLGNYSHAEGQNTLASGDYSHAEGYYAISSGDYSHAEGSGTIASGSYSHAEGDNTVAIGNNSHAEGTSTTASGKSSHAEGNTTTAVADYSHAEGGNTTASGVYSHAEGNNTTASGISSHAEGDSTTASGDYSHAEGNNTTASGIGSHAEGASTISSGDFSHTEGFQTKTGGNNGYLAISVSAGLVTLDASYGDVSADYPTGNYLYLNDYAYNNSYTTVALIIDSTSFNGTETEILLIDTSITTTTAVVGNINLNPANWTGDQVYGAPNSHAEGDNTLASGYASHAEGVSAIAAGGNSHAEGNFAIAIGGYSHAEGTNTKSTGDGSHAEGITTQSSGLYSHAEGQDTLTIGQYSHAEGNLTTAGWRAFTVTSVVAGLITISDNVDYTAAFTSGEVLLDTRVYTYNTIAFTSPDFTIQLDDTTVNSGTYVADFSNLNSPLASYIAGTGAHSTGNGTKALGDFSETGGDITLASGYGSHAEGSSTQATGDASHSEGVNTRAEGPHAHSEGYLTRASGDAAHAEGKTSIAHGYYSHAEGQQTTAYGQSSHAEGNSTTASGSYSHAEGAGTETRGNAAHAEGSSTIAIGDYSHTEGNTTQSGWRGFGVSSVVAGLITINDDIDYSAEFPGSDVLLDNIIYSYNSISFSSPSFTIQLDDITINTGTYVADLTNLTSTAYLATTLGAYSHAEGENTLASGPASHAEGESTSATSDYSHAEGFNTLASGSYSHAEGGGTTASGEYSHAEGGGTTASGGASHAEGQATQASGQSSHAEGESTTASGDYSHAEGAGTVASGYAAHAEGDGTISSGNYSHSEGDGTISSGNYSHAEGTSTIAGWRAFTVTSVVSGLITISDNVDYSSVFNSNIVILDNNEYGYNTIAFSSPNFTIQLNDTNVNTGTYVADFLNLNSPLATTTLGNGTHSAGDGTKAFGNYSHAEGTGTVSYGVSSHSEGYGSYTYGDYSHSEGYASSTYGNQSHAEGGSTATFGNYSHAEGYGTQSGWRAFPVSSVVAGLITISNNVDYTSQFTLGGGKVILDNNLYTYNTISYSAPNFTIQLDNITVSTGSYVADYTNLSSSWATIVLGTASHSEGTGNISTGDYSHAEGQGTTSIGQSSHSEGFLTKSIGIASHSEGYSTTSIGSYSHSAGYNAIASGNTSFIHSTNSVVGGDRSVVLGGQNITGLTNDTVYVPYFNLNYTPIFSNSNTEILSRNSSNGDVEYTPLSAFTSLDTYVTGYTYSPTTNTFTIKQNQGQPNISASFDSVSGLTVNGLLEANSMSANTFSATSIDKVDYIIFNTGTTSAATVAGMVYFDNTEKSLSYNTSINQGVTVNLGQQNYIRVFNNSGVDIQRGKALEVLSAYSGLPSVTLAVNKHTGFNIIGVSSEIIPNNTEGIAITNGIISDIQLTGITVGSLVYASDTVPGKLDDVTNYLNFPLTARTNSVGYVVQTGITTGKLFVNINNENSVLSLTDLERNVLEGNTLSTGLFGFTGMTTGSTTTFNVAPLKGWLIKNTYEYATLPDVQSVNYTGGTNISVTNIASADSTFILINSAITITQQTTFPTPQQRRENIYLGKINHPNRTSILNINNTADYDVSPMSSLRDLWSPIRLINQGIVPSPNGANLSFNTSAGILWGNGINWHNNQLSPNNVSIAAKVPVSFNYRTQTGGTSTSVTVIDPRNYDVGGVITSIGNAGLDDATNQRIYMYPTGVINVLYGQTVYTNLTAAVAAVQSESFIPYPNADSSGILIGVLSVRNDIGTDGQSLTNTSYAKFTFVSKFGESFGGTGGLSTTTLQQAYDNSTTPEITTNATLGGLSIKNGTGNADNVTNLIEGLNAAGNTTSFIRADGDISGTTIQTNGFTANTGGMTATTVSATTINTNGVTATTINTGGFSANGNGLTATTISATTLQTGGFSANTTGLSASTVNIRTIGSGSSVTNLGVDSSGNVVSGSTPSIPQANKIYVDSINGTNSTGQGNINAPYLTVEYALSDITNTGTVTATTANGSATLTSVSSTANIVIGQFITGTGIPYNSVVVSKTPNTIVLSQLCTASATITATWWTIYELILNGNFVWVSNWFKQGFFINAQTSTISFSGVLLSPTSPVVPIVFKGGFLYGTSASSKFLSINGSSVVKVFLNPTTYSSSGTGYQIDCNQNGSSKFDSLYLLCDSFLANFGSIADIESGGVSTIKGNYYGLLSGIRLRFATIFFDGDLICPTSVAAFTSVTSGYLFTNGRITGNLSIQSSGGVVNSTVTGTAHSLGSISTDLLQTFNGKILGTVSVQGICTFNGVVYGNITVVGGTSIFLGVSTTVATVTTSISVSNAKVIATGMASIVSGINGIGNITLTNSATLDILDNVIGVSYTTYSSVPFISVDATSTLNLYKTNFGNISSCAGTINVYGIFSHINKSADITGSLNNKGGTIQLLRSTTESATSTPTLLISGGTYQQNGGKLLCAVSDSKSGLLRKTATGGKIQLINQAYLKVANGLAPIQIISNTGTAQDVEVYSVIDNCAVGFRISNTFTDTTYGTAYSPNILVGGTMLEDTTYLL